MKLATDQAIKQWYTEQNIYSAKQGKLFSRLISWKLWLIGLVQRPEHLFYPEYMCPPVSLLLSNNKLASLFLECKSRFKVCYQFNKVVQCNTIVTHNESIPLMVLKLCSVVFKILGSIKVLISFSFFKFLFCLLFIYIMIFFFYYCCDIEYLVLEVNFGCSLIHNGTSLPTQKPGNPILRYMQENQLGRFNTYLLLFWKCMCNYSDM